MQQTELELPAPSRDANAAVRNVPWQLWVVIVLLAVEGIGNLELIPSQPIAALWLGIKILSIVGLLRRWRIIYVLFCLSAAWHAVWFSVEAPFVAFLNLVLVVLAISQHRRFFPARAR